MNLRTLIVGLLLVTVFLPFFSMPVVTSSQATATATTMTIAQPPSQGQCTTLPLAFSAHSGEQITGTYGSDVSINFYILSQSDLNSIQNCRLEPTVRPIFQAEKSVGHDNPYRSLSFPSNGTYYFVFMFVRGPTQLTKGYATVELSYPSTVVIMSATGSAPVSLLSTMISPTSNSSSLSTTTSIVSSVTVTSPPPSTAETTSITPPSASTTSLLTETSAPSSYSIFGLPFTSLLLAIVVIIVGVGGVAGATVFRNSKRRTLSNYLARIDSTYNEFAVDREECRSQLERLKTDVIEMLNKGKIDEGHFLMLDEKITEYLKDLIQATPKYKRASVTDDTTAAATDVRSGTATVDQLKYCSNCGAKVSLDDKVCKQCGAAL